MKVKKKTVKSKIRIVKKKAVKKKAVKKKAVKKKAVKKKAVKKKVVKKKEVKKKAVKKKVVKKKTVKKKAVKKTKKIRCKRKKILMEDIYSILNKVQMKKKKVTFAAHVVDSLIIENNIKDADLDYNKVEMKTQVIFTIYPNDTEYDDNDDIKLDIMDDEIPDIDQIFG